MEAENRASIARCDFSLTRHKVGSCHRWHERADCSQRSGPGQNLFRAGCVRERFPYRVLLGSSPLTSALALQVMSSGISLTRSEEHTSELQSRVDLVCRLLLEKKKKI